MRLGHSSERRAERRSEAKAELERRRGEADRRIEEKRQADAAQKEWVPPKGWAKSGAEPAEDVTPVSLAIALAGAGLMLVSVFLARVESTTFGTVAQNTLIQTGDGWVFIGVAVGIAGVSWRAYRRQRASAGPIVLGAIGIAVAVYEGTNHDSLKLCPVGAQVIHTGCSQAAPGIGIYAAGVGGLLAVIGGWQMFRSRRTRSSSVVQQAPSETPPIPTPDPGSSLAQRLATLDSLHSDQLISDAEYEDQRSRLLDEI